MRRIWFLVAVVLSLLRPTPSEASYVETSGSETIFSGSTPVGTISWDVYSQVSPGGNWETQFGITPTSSSGLTGTEQTAFAYNVTYFAPFTGDLTSLALPALSGAYTGVGYQSNVGSTNPTSESVTSPNFTFGASVGTVPHTATLLLATNGTYAPSTGTTTFSSAGALTESGLPVAAAVTPEPSSLLLGSLGFLGFAGWMRRRQALEKKA